MLKKETAWKEAGKWYDSIVQEKGHFYHQTVIIPKVLELLELKPKDTLLDIACGQGVLARHIPKGVSYVGLDASDELIHAAKKMKTSDHNFLVQDVTCDWKLGKDSYSHAACILAIQNIKEIHKVFSELSKALRPKGRAIFVLNHPCFRIPRQTRWNFDEKSKTQTREIFSYMTHHEIPITTHPGSSQGTTWSFHDPISAYADAARKTGFYITAIEEWCSPKTSTGKASSWENRARKEFPLFLAFLFEKKSF